MFFANSDEELVICDKKFKWFKNSFLFGLHNIKYE